MSFSPRFQDDLLPVAQFTFQDDLNNIINIAGQAMGNFTLIMTPRPGVDQPGLARIVGTGVFSYVTDGTDGKINYAWVTADVHVPGQYNVFAVAVINTKPMTSDALPLTINPKP